MTFHLTYFHIIFSSVRVAEWSPSWEIAAHSVAHMFSLHFVILVICRFGFGGRVWVLIASVPDRCRHFTNIAHVN